MFYIKFHEIMIFSLFTKFSLLHHSLKKISSPQISQGILNDYRRCIKMWYAYVVCENYERLLLATHHGLARTFRCQFFISVRRREFEAREIHGQDAALVEAERTQGDVVPAVLLKYERNVSVSEDECACRREYFLQNGKGYRKIVSLKGNRFGRGNRRIARRRPSTLVSAGYLWKIFSGSYRSRSCNLV